MDAHIKLVQPPVNIIACSTNCRRRVHNEVICMTKNYMLTTKKRRRQRDDSCPFQNIDPQSTPEVGGMAVFRSFIQGVHYLYLKVLNFHSFVYTLIDLWCGNDLAVMCRLIFTKD